MSRWASLDLGTKMDMYRAKLDLELDAHNRLLNGLLDQIDDMPSGPARTALVDQVGAARSNLANLLDRRIELARFGPLDRLAARFGKGKLASRLEQAPRLFAKAGKATKATKAAKAAKASKAAKPAKPAKPAKKGKPPPTKAMSAPKSKPTKTKQPRPRRSPRRSIPTRPTQGPGPTSSNVPPPLRRRARHTPRSGSGRSGSWVSTSWSPPSTSRAATGPSPSWGRRGAGPAIRHAGLEGPHHQADHGGAPRRAQRQLPAQPYPR